MIKSESIKELATALSDPFTDEELEWRLQPPFYDSNKKAIAVPYVTARAIMNRLDDVLGIDNWADEYELITYSDIDKKGEQVASYGFKCRLSVKIDDKWITKQDVAAFTDIEDLKGGCSDALKRTAVKFGIGRYLYNLNEQLVDLLLTRPTETGYKRHYVKKDSLTLYWYPPVVDVNGEVKKSPKQDNKKPPAQTKANKPDLKSKREQAQGLIDELKKDEYKGKVDFDALLSIAQTTFRIKMATFDEIFEACNDPSAFLVFIPKLERKLDDLIKGGK
ncbi:MAG: hypothetical protein FJ045_02415 [Crenarchaeota archaeon]|nr:hypothetical protein [Thermoproteota archaeon]